MVLQGIHDIPVSGISLKNLMALCSKSANSLSALCFPDCLALAIVFIALF